MQVSIIIVNYNTLELTNNCIKSIKRHTKDVDYEIILVDNASTDGSIEFFSNFEDVLFIKSPENLGFGKANNLGIEIAKGRNIFLLNPDTILLNNAISELSNYLDSNLSVGVVGANLYNEDGSPQPCFCHYFPSISFELGNLFHLLFLSNREVFNFTSQPKQVSRVVGAAMMVKKEAIRKAGMFNSHFFMYAEEDEWCFRITRNGFKIFNLPQAKITHLDGKSFQFSEERQKRKLEGLRTFYKITYSPLYCFFLRLIEYFTMLSRLLIYQFLKDDKKRSYWEFMYKNRKWK